MKIRYYFLVSIFVFALILNDEINGQSLTFENIAGKYGFSLSSVSCLLQDRQGLIWIGTTDGLFQFDGSDFKEYRFDNKDTTSISGNYIKCLYEDEASNIWIGTSSGLNCFDGETEEFKRHLILGDPNIFEEQNNIHSVVEDHKGFLWYGTYGGLFRLDPKTADLLHFLPQIENPNSISHKNVWKVFESQNGKLWIGTGKGLTVYNNDGSFQFERYMPENGNPNGLKTDRVWEFAEQPNGTIWLGTNKGIYRVLNEDGEIQFKEFSHDPKNLNSLSNDFIERIVADGQDTLWVGTYDGGLNKIVVLEDGLSFTHYNNDTNALSSLRMNKVNAFLRDHSNNLWVGSAGGLGKASPLRNKFSSIPPHFLSNEIVKSILRDSHGNLWVGTRYGLNFLPKEQFEKINYQFKKLIHHQENPLSISHNNIFGLLEDDQGNIWICTYKGLNYIKLKDFEKSISQGKTPAFKHFLIEDGLPHNFIRNIAQIDSNEFWVLTYGQLSKMVFDPLNKSKTRFQNFDMDNSQTDALVNASTMVAEKDRFGNFWIGTFNGLSKYINTGVREYFDNYKNEIGNPKSLSNNLINDILRDSKGRLWVATRGGLNLVIQDSAHDQATFQNFGFYEGISNDVIQSMEEDQNGKLWLGTNRGLVHFDPDASESPVIATYYLEDGLLSNGLVFRASHRDSAGRLYFGTPAGLNHFLPQNMDENKIPPKVRLSELKVLNEVVASSTDKNAILKKSISYTDTIYLKYFQNMIGIKFSALDYTTPTKNEYAYRLSTINKDWVYAGTVNHVDYTNLSPGKYTFEVKGSNNDGVWSEHPRVLHIIISPPLWKTWWAYLIYAISIGMGIYLFTKQRIAKKIKKIAAQTAIEKARFEEREQLRKQNAADFHDDLGHRLTKIALFLELADRQSSDQNAVKNWLKKIGEHTTGLSTGMRDLIWTLDPKSDTLFQTMLRLQEFGDKLFEGSTTHFITEGLLEKFDLIPLEPDVRKQVLMIYKEGMHNCLKYASAEKCILKFVLKENNLEIILNDDGKGFDSQIKAKGYGVKNMSVRSDKIGAKLEIDSKIGRGTKIRLLVKLPQMG